MPQAAAFTAVKLRADKDAQEFLGWLEKWIGAERFKRIPKEKTRHGSAMINSFEVNKLQFGGEFHRRCGNHRFARGTGANTSPDTPT